MKMIYRDKLLDVLYEEQKSDDCRGSWFSTITGIIRIIKSAPTAEIIPCCQCDHYQKQTEHTGYCGWHLMAGYKLAVAYNDFCSMANADSAQIRKDDKEE